MKLINHERTEKASINNFIYSFVENLFSLGSFTVNAELKSFNLSLTPSKL